MLLYIMTKYTLNLISYDSKKVLILFIVYIKSTTSAYNVEKCLYTNDKSEISLRTDMEIDKLFCAVLFRLLLYSLCCICTKYQRNCKTQHIFKHFCH